MTNPKVGDLLKNGDVVWKVIEVVPGKVKAELMHVPMKAGFLSVGTQKYLHYWDTMIVIPPEKLEALRPDDPNGRS